MRDCPLERAYCPECDNDINFKKSDKDFCNCKKCNWKCTEYVKAIINRV